MSSETAETRSPSLGERVLHLFAAVRPGEATTALLLLVNLFLLLVGYYILKTVREPLILASGAEVKSYAAAGQAVLLMGFIPLYSWFSSKVNRERLVLGVTLFFIVNVELFYVGGRLGVPYLGVAFYIWVGIFSLATIAQFWSYANDLYVREAGERLFPIIAVGATAGSPIGAKIAETLFDMKVDPFNMLHITAALLLVQLALYWIVNRRETLQRGQAGQQSLAGAGGFALVLRSRYLLLIALLLVVLNIVNTTGEYILGSSVVNRANEMAAADPGFDKDSFIGAFYGSYFFGVNVLALVIQAFLVSRVVALFGVAGAVLALPLVALGVYGFVAAGAAFAALRWAKTAENAMDYSIMNTGKQMLWLPTSREEKYKAKQAIDTFFFRAGDLLSAGIVYIGTQVVTLDPLRFARLNVVIVLAWLGVCWLLLREHRRVVAIQDAAAAAPGVH